MTDSPGWQGPPEAERSEKNGPVVNNNRQIARARNQRGVVRRDRRMRQESKAADRSSEHKSRLRDGKR